MQGSANLLIAVVALSRCDMLTAEEGKTKQRRNPLIVGVDCEQST